MLCSLEFTWSEVTKTLFFSKNLVITTRVSTSLLVSQRAPKKSALFLQQTTENSKMSRLEPNKNAESLKKISVTIT